MQSTPCRNCSVATTGKYCQNCGERVSVASITLHGILHEIWHYFTHLDKGFGFTLKRLIKDPGGMQRSYINGDRARHQKPFSMFFVCGTLSGIGYYFVNVAHSKLYGTLYTQAEIFYRHYFVLTQAALLPIYVLFTWVCFIDYKYNYAETLIMMLYNLALVYLVLVPIVSTELLFTGFDSRVVELAFLLVYNCITNIKFYGGNPFSVIVRTLVVLLGCYILSQFVSQYLIANMS